MVNSPQALSITLGDVPFDAALSRAYRALSEQWERKTMESVVDVVSISTPSRTGRPRSLTPAGAFAKAEASVLELKGLNAAGKELEGLQFTDAPRRNPVTWPELIAAWEVVLGEARDALEHCCRVPTPDQRGAIEMFQRATFLLEAHAEFEEQDKRCEKQQSSPSIGEGGPQTERGWLPVLQMNRACATYGLELLRQVLRGEEAAMAAVTNLGLSTRSGEELTRATHDRFPVAQIGKARAAPRLIEDDVKDNREKAFTTGPQSIVECTQTWALLTRRLEYVLTRCSLGRGEAEAGLAAVADEYAALSAATAVLLARYPSTR